MLFSKTVNGSTSHSLQACFLSCALILVPAGFVGAQDFEAVERRLGEGVSKGELTLKQAATMMDALRKVATSDPLKNRNSEQARQIDAKRQSEKRIAALLEKIEHLSIEVDQAHELAHLERARAEQAVDQARQARNEAIKALKIAEEAALKNTTSSKKEATDERARAEFRPAQTQPSDEMTEALVVGTSEKIFLHKEIVASSSDIDEAGITLGANGKPVISITFSDEGAKKIGEACEKYLGKRLAIVVDGQVISAPTIRGRISKNAVIDGDFDINGASRIASALTAK